VGHASGVLSSLDPHTGDVVEEVDLGGDAPFEDLDADPLVKGGRLIVASAQAGIFALEPFGLARLWHLPEPGIVRIAGGGDDIVVAAGAGKVLAIAANDGRVLWRFSFARGSPTRPVVRGGRVHVASDRGALYVLDLFSGKPLQYYGSGLGIAADLEIVGDMLFVVTAAGELHGLSSAFAGPIQRRR
jgi:outer membrane protein assembly factor BamB